jgi:hypothetical protein
LLVKVSNYLKTYFSLQISMMARMVLVSELM